MILKGIDEDWSKVDPWRAWQDGFRFIFGYVSQDMTGKNFAPSDVSSILSNGFAIGLVYEYNPQSALGGYSQGVTDAQIAIAHAQSLGAPLGVALYAAVDWNVQPGQMSTCLAYATGFLATCSAVGYRSGIYGGYPLCLYLQQHNYGGFLWQTYAWSNGAWLAGAAVRQTQNGVSEAGVTIDLDESEVIDFGQWQPISLVSSVSTLEDDGRMVLAIDSNGTLYLCNGLVSRVIHGPKSVTDLLYLASKGDITLSTGDNDTEWQGWGGTPRCIRTGWSADVFGVVTG